MKSKIKAICLQTYCKGRTHQQNRCKNPCLKFQAGNRISDVNGRFRPRVVLSWRSYLQRTALELLCPKMVSFLKNSTRGGSNPNTSERSNNITLDPF
eukprot:2644726-Amphidinium_carterae.1